MHSCTDANIMHLQVPLCMYYFPIAVASSAHADCTTVCYSHSYHSGCSCDSNSACNYSLFTSQQMFMACRSQQGASGVQTLRLTPDDLRPGTIFFAFFNVDYFVHQRYSFIFLVSPSRLLLLCLT